MTKSPFELTMEVARAVRSAGGRALIVGGYPRDLALGLVPKDIDIEVYGLEVPGLLAIVEPIHPVSQVGASFGVLKMGPLDISLPRTDSSTGSGHRGFTVQSNPYLTHKEAAHRRDFTVNAMAFDPLTDELFDEYEGMKDIRHKVLRAVDLETFKEDPLRTLRAMQFAGRFEFTLDQATAELIRKLDLSELSTERVGEEWQKLLIKSKHPSIGLRVAQKLNIISKLHPELDILIGTQQDPLWHPEGSVWNHTLLALDVAAEIVRREHIRFDDALVLMLATLCHDFGKPATTALIDGRLRSPGHSQAGLEPARRFMKQLHIPHSITVKVMHLIADHMFLIDVSHAKDAAIRRLAKRLAPATIKQLVWLSEADYRGRTRKEWDISPITLLAARAKDLEVDTMPLRPLVCGQDLIGLGVQPGKEMGNILLKLEQAQMEGAFGTREHGLLFYRDKIQ